MSFSWRKSIAFAAFLTLGSLLVTEVATRIIAFVTYGFSPYFLTYGFSEGYVEGAEGHNAMYDGYFKFPPSRTLHQYGLFRESTPIRINNRGFRGPDFTPKKPRPAFRVVCMGGSSTFGFYDRDGYSYPALLETSLRDALPSLPIDVVNAGIPHSTSANILAMLRAEILDYDPDVVTFYEVFNDAGFVMDENRIEATARWAHAHLATYVALKRVLETVGGPILHSRWATYLPRSNAEYVRRQIGLHVPRYEKHLKAFVDTVRSAGAYPVLIRQPMTTKHSSDHPRGSPDPLLTYEQEVEWIREHLQHHGWVSSIEALMLVHRALLDVLDRVAAEHRVTVVDNVAIVDRHPEFFASYVHLTEGANGKLAAVLADVILPVAKREAQTRKPSRRYNRATSTQ